MSIRLLDASEAQRYRIGMNNDPEFKLLGRDMTLNLVIEVGKRSR